MEESKLKREVTKQTGITILQVLGKKEMEKWVKNKKQLHYKTEKLKIITSYTSLEYSAKMKERKRSKLTVATKEKYIKAISKATQNIVYIKERGPEFIRLWRHEI